MAIWQDHIHRSFLLKDAVTIVAFFSLCLTFARGHFIVYCLLTTCNFKFLQYIATVAGLLLAFLSGFVLEVLLIVEGCRGRLF